MGVKRQAREAALQVLCLLDAQPGLSPQEGLRLFFQHMDGGAPETSGPQAEPAQPRPVDQRADVRRAAEALVLGAHGALGDIDALLARSSRNWRLERMAWVDRNLLRLGAYELSCCKDVPARVALNEAIELAKTYGTGESPAFINGVLDRVLESLGPGLGRRV